MSAYSRAVEAMAALLPGDPQRPVALLGDWRRVFRFAWNAALEHVTVEYLSPACTCDKGNGPQHDSCEESRAIAVMLKNEKVKP